MNKTKPIIMCEKIQIKGPFITKIKLLYLSFVNFEDYTEIAV